MIFDPIKTLKKKLCSKIYLSNPPYSPACRTEAFARSARNAAAEPATAATSATTVIAVVTVTVAGRIAAAVAARWNLFAS